MLPSPTAPEQRTTSGRFMTALQPLRHMAGITAIRRGSATAASIAAGLIRPRAAFVHEAHRLRPRNIAGLDPVDAKARRFDHRSNRAVEMTTSTARSPDRRQPILPATHALVGSEAVFDKQKLATRPQDAPHLRKGGSG